MDTKGLIDQLTTKLNITEAQAQEAINTVLGFVRQKFPDVGNQLDGLVAKIDRDGDGLDVDDIKGALGGVFGKKKG